MNSIALFTIVIPTLNRCTLLKRCLDSALNQTIAASVLVSDNGSIDGTQSFLEAYSTSHSSFRIIRHNTTIPVQQHSWHIISKIETPWAIFLSDDDFLELDFIENISSLIDENDDIDLIYTGCDIIYDDVIVPAKVGPRFEISPDFLMEFMKGERNICMCATAFRVDDLRRIGPQPDDILIGDMYYWTRILTPGRVVGCAAGHHSNYLMYRPQHSSETNRADLTPWARESESLSRIMSENIYSNNIDRYDIYEIERSRRKYLSITIANHFIFSTLKNTSRSTLLANFIELHPLISPELTGLLRSLGAILLPRIILHWIVLISARLLKSTSKGWSS